jgi:ankyrin repeat protein
MIASQNGHVPVVKLLLDGKADVNQAKKSGETALILASRKGNKALVKLLLEGKYNSPNE